MFLNKGAGFSSELSMFHDRKRSWHQPIAVRDRPSAVGDGQGAEYWFTPVVRKRFAALGPQQSPGSADDAGPFWPNRWNPMRADLPAATGADPGQDPTPKGGRGTPPPSTDPKMVAHPSGSHIGWRQPPCRPQHSARRCRDRAVPYHVPSPLRRLSTASASS